MAGTGKNLVFSSRAAGNGKEGGPTYVEGLLTGSLLPGTMVEESASGFAVYDGTTSDADPLILDINAVKQGNMSDPWTTGETAVALNPRPTQYFNVRTEAAFTGNKGDGLSINATGQVAVAAATEIIKFYLDETVAGLAADSLVRVRRASGVGPTV